MHADENDLADVRFWHETADPGCPLIGRYRVISGLHMQNASSSHFDPLRTYRGNSADVTEFNPPEPTLAQDRTSNGSDIGQQSKSQIS